MVGIYEPHTKKNLPYIRMVNNYAAGISQTITIVGAPRNSDECENMQISFVYYRMRTYVKELLQMEARFREKQLLISRADQIEKATDVFPFTPGKEFKMEIVLNGQNPLVLRVDGKEIKHEYFEKHIDDYLHVVTVNGDVKLHEFHVNPEPAKQVMEENSRVVITPANGRPYLSNWTEKLHLYQNSYFHYLSGFHRGKRIVLDVAVADRSTNAAIELVSLENRIGPGFKLYKPFVMVLEFDRRKVFFCKRNQPEETDNNQFDYLSDRFQVQEIKKPFPFFFEQRMTIELESDPQKPAVKVKVNGVDFGRYDDETFDMDLINMLAVSPSFKLFSLSIEPDIDQHTLSGGEGAKVGGGVVLESDGTLGRLWKPPYEYTDIGGFVPPKWFRLFGTVPSRGYWAFKLYDGAGNKLFHIGFNLDPPDWHYDHKHRFYVYCWWVARNRPWHVYDDLIAYGDTMPFTYGEPFSIDLTAGKNEIIVSINGKHFFTAGNWKEEDLKKIQTLRIEGHLIIHGFYSERTGDLKLPYSCDLFGFLPPTHFRVFGNMTKEGVFFIRLYDAAATDDEKYMLSFSVNIVGGKKFIDRWWLGKPEYKERIAEGASVPFEVGRPFWIDLVAGNEQIIFNVNGKKFNTVSTSPEDLKKVARLKVLKDIHLHSCELNVPYSGDIKNGFVLGGKKIRLVLVPLNRGDKKQRFDLFDPQNEIVFCFESRFSQKKCVRNTWKKADGWLKEESDGPFPFIFGKQHVLEFVAQKEKIEIVVDGKKEFEFKTRDDMSVVNKFEVSGDMILQSAEVRDK